jgi:hypothetical protein
VILHGFIAKKIKRSAVIFGDYGIFYVPVRRGLTVVPGSFIAAKIGILEDETFILTSFVESDIFLSHHVRLLLSHFLPVPDYGEFIAIEDTEYADLYFNVFKSTQEDLSITEIAKMLFKITGEDPISYVIIQEAEDSLEEDIDLKKIAEKCAWLWQHQNIDVKLTLSEKKYLKKIWRQWRKHQDEVDTLLRFFLEYLG